MKNFKEFINEGNLIKNWKQLNNFYGRKDVNDYIDQLKKEGKTNKEIDKLLEDKFPELKEIRKNTYDNVHSKMKTFGDKLLWTNWFKNK